MQLSAIPIPVTYTPVQAVAPIAPVKTRDAGIEDVAPKLRAAPPSGAGSRIDIEA